MQQFRLKYAINKKLEYKMYPSLSGVGDGIRTHDLRDHNPTL